MYVLYNTPWPYVTTDGLVGPKLLSEIDSILERTDFSRFEGYDARGGSRQKFQYHMGKDKSPLVRDEGTHPLEEIIDTRSIEALWDQSGKNILDNHRMLNEVEGDDRPFSSVVIELIRGITPESMTAYPRYDSNRMQNIIMLRWQGLQEHMRRGFEVKLGKKAMGNLIPWQFGHTFSYIPNEETTFVKYPVTTNRTYQFINIGLR